MSKLLSEQNVSELVERIYSLSGDSFDLEVMQIEKDLKSYVYKHFTPEGVQERLLKKTCESWWKEKGEILATAFRSGGTIVVEPQPTKPCKWRLHVDFDISSQ